jgi:hypothetical protein
MTDHRSELRRQLLDAAARRARDAATTAPTPADGPGRATGRRWAPTVAVAVATALAIALAAGVLGTEARPAAADTFEIERDGEDLVIDVVGRVDDPDEAARELRAVGQEVVLIGVPAAPTMVGVVVSASAEITEPRVEVRDGRVESIRVRRDQPHLLTIRYGRGATGGEAFEATESIPNCRSFAGEAITPERVQRIERAHGPQVRWQQVGAEGVGPVEESEIDDDATFLDILPLSGNTVMVVVTDGTPAPPGMAC